MCCRGCGIGLGVIAIAIGIISIYCGSMLPPYANEFLKNKIEKNKILGLDENGDYNEVTKKFLNPPYPMKIEFWIYNTTNAYDLTQAKAHTAIVKELGPYTFDMKMSKKVELRKGGTRIAYRTYTTYHFNDTATCPTCSLDDVVIVPNVAFQGILHNVKNMSGFIQFGFGMKTWWEGVEEWPPLHTIYQQQLARELLFEGVQDKIVDRLCALKKDEKCQRRPDRIGLYYKRNDTNVDGEYEIDTGKEDVMKLGKVYSWNGLKGSLNDSYWFGDQARKIEGTDTQMFPPFVLLDRKSFKIFTGQACRSLEMEFQGFSVVGGLPMQRYGPAKSMQMDWKKGFCGKGRDQDFFDGQKENCPPSGLMELDGCNPAALRIYASNGHFYGADDRLLANMTGFSTPNGDDDTTFLDIEPHIGVITQAKSRSLLSVGVRGKGFEGIASDMTERVLPLVMLNISTQFNSETRDLIKTALLAIHFKVFIPEILHAISITSFIVVVMFFTCDAIKIGAHRYKYGKVAPKMKESIFVSTRSGETATLAANSTGVNFNGKEDNPLKSLKLETAVQSKPSPKHSFMVTASSDPLHKV